MLKRRQWLLAGLLAGFATWTRAAGAMLFLPLIGTWGFDLYNTFKNTEPAQRKPIWQLGLNLVCTFGPVFAYLIWNATLGGAFHKVEDLYFSRGLLLWGQSMNAWGDAFSRFISSNLQAHTYFAVEFISIILAVLACIVTAKRYPLIAAYGLMVIVFSFFSGAAQGMHRYVLAVPSIFIMLARWGKNPVFDRSWTIISVLTMGLMATLFTFDFWAG